MEARPCVCVARKSTIHDVTLFGGPGITIPGVWLLLWNNALQRTLRSCGYHTVSTLCHSLPPISFFAVPIAFFGNDKWFAARRDALFPIKYLQRSILSLSFFYPLSSTQNPLRLRRQMLLCGSLVSFALAFLSSVSAFTPGFPYGSQKVRGVSLGGWLVL